MPETQHRPQDVALRAAWARCIGGRLGPVKHKRAENSLFFLLLWIARAPCSGRQLRGGPIPIYPTTDRRLRPADHKFPATAWRSRTRVTTTGRWQSRFVLNLPTHLVSWPG